jgi:hypothetical protein
LVRLDTDQHHQACAGDLDHRRETIAAYARIGLIECMDVDLNIRPQHVTFGAIFGKTI